MRINLHGGANSGKSTNATFLFSELKIKNYKIELCSEYIKSWAWAKQLHYEDRVLRYGAHIVSDSPLLMQIAYMQRENNSYWKECLDLCAKFDKIYPSINIYLLRDVEYKEEGRYENYEQALEMDERIKDLLVKYTPDCVAFGATKRYDILDYVLEKLNAS